MNAQTRDRLVAFVIIIVMILASMFYIQTISETWPSLGHVNPLWRIVFSIPALFLIALALYIAWKEL